MDLNARISAFVQLGKIFDYIGNSKSWDGHHLGINEEEFCQLEATVPLAKIHNGWFEEVFVRLAFKNVAQMLDENELKNWVKSYDLDDKEPLKTIAIIMAGNIPMVGFHDLLCVLISGNKALIKFSSDDNILLPKVIEILCLLQPEFKDRINITNGRLKHFDAVIATGSNNTGRYFDYYFGKYPNIIRKNRTSVAILNGSETDEDLKLLADDIFTYFGLGCRNVSKVYLPKGFDLDKLFKAFYHYNWVVNNKKYGNNYDYQRTLLMMNKEPFLENGFFILRENTSLRASLATLHYEFYEQKKEVLNSINALQNELQCFVNTENINLGKGQCPQLTDYADNIDTLIFLKKFVKVITS